MLPVLPGAKFLAPILGAIAILLRMLMLLTGPDDRGLYPTYHPAWVLLCVLAVLVVAFFFLLSRNTDTRRPYRVNFPPSTAGAFGHLAAALAIGITCIRELPENLGQLLGLLGILSAISLALGGWLRLTGRKPAFYVHMLPCFYLGVRLFALGKVVGAEPEASRYLFRFLAVLACLPATYQLWGFDVGMGNRNKSIFWSLTAAFLCLAAIPGSPDGLLHAGLALWLLTNLCDLAPRRRRRIPAKKTTPTVQPAPAATADMDIDQLIAWVLEGLDD